MKLDEFNAAAADILAHLDDQGLVSNKLAELTQGFSEEASAREAADTKVTDLTAANDKLRQDNMSLFLRVTTPTVQNQNVTPTPNNNETEDPIAALFNDGGLKWMEE